jgi:hypothetical protein
MCIEPHLVTTAAALFLAAFMVSVITGGTSHDEVPVPDVVGANVDSAYDELRGAGFAVGIEEPIDMGFNWGWPLVGEQSVAGGKTAPRGGVILLKLGQDGGMGPGMIPWNTSTVRTPTLVGMPLPQAVGALVRLGLSWGIGPLPAFSGSAEPTLLRNYVVASQEPEPGSVFTQTRLREIPGGTMSETRPIGLQVRLRHRASRG